ncbi:hypothetical protein ACHAPT_009977 [Fusarium lateritium]
MAVACLGVGLCVENYMLVVDDENLDMAAQKLKEAGFQEALWSYGSRDDPALYTDRKMQQIHRRVAQQYSNLDKHSIRFRFPTDELAKARVVLLPSSYAHISATSGSEDKFEREGNILYPNAALLLESFVRTRLSEPKKNSWALNLEMWVVTYLWGDLMLDDGILDNCDDEEVKAFFNELIRKDKGGIDRVTCTKRLGRVGYDESLARKK